MTKLLNFPVNVSVYNIQRKFFVSESIDDCYKRLIEKCCDSDPKKRPSFDEIVSHLRNNKGFITEKINKTEFLNYIYYVDQFQRNESNNQIIQLYDAIDSNSSTF